ncbi:hypothetical protein THAOC_09226, partial [Thalassiosira oceanica]
SILRLANDIAGAKSQSCRAATLAYYGEKVILPDILPRQRKAASAACDVGGDSVLHLSAGLDLDCGREFAAWVVNDLLHDEGRVLMGRVRRLVDEGCHGVQVYPTGLADVIGPLGRGVPRPRAPASDRGRRAASSTQGASRGAG